MSDTAILIVVGDSVMLICGRIVHSNEPDARSAFVIDNQGYRANVGMVIFTHNSQLFWARRYGQHSWQFPQGGIQANETPEHAMYRELFEEVGLNDQDVKLIAIHPKWLRYKIPKHLVRWDSHPVCLGQKQKWFLLKLEENGASKINFGLEGHPEFDDWNWVNYWYPIRQVVAFKREVYRRVLKDFSHFVFEPKTIKSFRRREMKKTGKGC